MLTLTSSTLTLSCYQSNQSRIMRNRTYLKNTPSPHPSLLPGLSFAPDSSSSFPNSGAGGREWGLRSVHHTLFLPLLPPQGEDSSHSSPAPAWGPSHGGQPYRSLSNTSPSPGLQSSTNCSSVGSPTKSRPSSGPDTRCGVGSSTGCRGISAPVHLLPLLLH